MVSVLCVVLLVNRGSMKAEEQEVCLEKSEADIQGFIQCPCLTFRDIGALWLHTARLQSWGERQIFKHGQSDITENRQAKNLGCWWDGGEVWYTLAPVRLGLNLNTERRSHAAGWG